LIATEKDGALLVDILVQPRASREGVGPVVGDRLKVAVNSPPVDGEANAAVVRTVAAALGVRPSAVEILRGQTGRRKTLKIQGITLQDLQRFLAAEPRRR
jgi:uncharacterized protein